MKDGDLVLIDAGCEYQYYASDVTRTFPINGRFTGEQRAIYEIVLAAQEAAIAAAQPGAHFNVPHETAIDVMVDGLLTEGLLKGDKAEIVEAETYKKFCVHKTSHWLGIDVHDVGDYRVDDTWRALEPGMVLTVEPGIYIAPDEADAPQRFRGIGVRIEDDVLITKTGNEVLTAAAPKEIDAVEAAMHG
jgi:Xaa-Pro aminopeptidase